MEEIINTLFGLDEVWSKALTPLSNALDKTVGGLLRGSVARELRHPVYEASCLAFSIAMKLQIQEDLVA